VSTHKKYAPAEALDIARRLMRKGLFQVGDPELPNELAELGIVGDEAMREALLAALEEVGADCYLPMAQPHKNPGIPFVWKSTFFEGRRMYLKFKLVGSRPTLWLYSCHEAYF